MPGTRVSRNSALRTRPHQHRTYHAYRHARYSSVEKLCAQNTATSASDISRLSAWQVLECRETLRSKGLAGPAWIGGHPGGREGGARSKLRSEHDHIAGLISLPQGNDAASYPVTPLRTRPSERGLVVSSVISYLVITDLVIRDLAIRSKFGGQRSKLAGA
jgi:hypothetical protein